MDISYVDPRVAIGGPAQLLQSTLERRDAGLLDEWRAEENPEEAGSEGHPGGEYPQLRTLIGAARSRIRAINWSSTNGYSITSSARCCRNKGTSTPIAFAVFRLITSSNFVGCSTGRSAGLVPCNILDTNTALRLYMCDKSAPYDNSPPASTKGRSTEADVVGI